jgi:raffinose/stachyose/melibiose transport system substrate-binding protein
VHRLRELLVREQERLREDIQATLDFLYWCVTSDEGTSALADDMGFVCPFKSAKESTNPLVKIANEYVANGKASVAWCFTTMPSEEWKNGVGTALTAYAAGTGDWDGVKTAFVDGWAKEYAAQRLISLIKHLKLIPKG